MTLEASASRVSASVKDDRWPQGGKEMSRLGHTTKRFYKETRGMKVNAGQRVKSGTMLTREGHRWRAGQNVNGMTHLTAACDGEVYFTKKKGSYGQVVTCVNVKAQ